MCSSLAIFRVTIAASSQHVADNRVAILKLPGKGTECGSVSEPLTRLVRQNTAVTSKTELAHTAHRSRVPPTHKENPTTELLAALMSGWDSQRSASHDKLPASRIAALPHCRYPLAILEHITHGQDNPVNETSAVHITVRIQESAYGQFSCHYDQDVLLSKITTVNFFAWFARCTGYTHPSGLAKLKITLKDALPTAVHGRIIRGDEEHFEQIKQDIKPHLERAKALMPGLMEFTILVTVPGWTVERQK